MKKVRGDKDGNCSMVDCGKLVTAATRRENTYIERDVVNVLLISSSTKTSMMNEITCGATLSLSFRWQVVGVCMHPFSTLPWHTSFCGHCTVTFRLNLSHATSPKANIFLLPAYACLLLLETTQDRYLARWALSFSIPI